MDWYAEMWTNAIMVAMTVLLTLNVIIHMGVSTVYVSMDIPKMGIYVRIMTNVD